MTEQRDLFDDRPIRPIELPPTTTPEFPFGVPEGVCVLFEKLALEIAKQGWERYSSDAILHRIRWHYHIDRGIRDFKCNDHWTAALARWFLARHPNMTGFFELRRSPGIDEAP